MIAITEVLHSTEGGLRGFTINIKTITRGVACDQLTGSGLRRGCLLRSLTPRVWVSKPDRLTVVVLAGAGF